MAEALVKPPEEQTKEELAATIAAEEARIAAEKPAEPKPEAVAKPEEKAKFEFKASDGTIYEAESQDELFKKITGALDNTKVALKDRERQIREVRQQQPKPEEKPSEKTTGTFSRDKWLELMESGTDGPLKAQEYMDSFRKPEWAKKAEEREQVVQQTETLQQEILKFYASPTGQQYAKVETPELNQKILQYMADRNMPRTSANFKEAFWDLKEAGDIPVASEKKEKPKAPPRTPDSGSSRETPTNEPDFDKMSKEELAKYIRSKGVEVYVQR